MIGKHSWRGGWLIALPLAAGLRGIALSLGRRRPQWVPYYLLYASYNYVGMLAAFREAVGGRHASRTTGTLLKRG